MYIEQNGQGRDIVLLHGWGMHGGVWDAISTELKNEFSIHCIDLPGFGYSREMNGDYTLDELSQSVIDIINEKKLHDIILVGWSLGGLVAQNICFQQSSLVSRLVLIASTPRFTFAKNWPHGIDPMLLEIFNTSMKEDYRKTVLRFMSLQMLGDENGMIQLRQLRESIFVRGLPNPQALYSGLAILHQSDLRDQSYKILQPTLCVVGDKDQIVKVAAVKDSIALLPDAQYAVIKNAAHALFLSHQAEFIKLFIEFVYEK